MQSAVKAIHVASEAAFLDLQVQVDTLEGVLTGLRNNLTLLDTRAYDDAKWLNAHRIRYEKSAETTLWAFSGKVNTLQNELDTDKSYLSAYEGVTHKENLRLLEKTLELLEKTARTASNRYNALSRKQPGAERRVLEFDDFESRKF